VKEIVAKANEDFLILKLYPSYLVHHLVAPLVQTLVAHLNIAVQDPKEAKTSFLEFFYLQVHDFPVAHGVIIERPIIIGKHETCILSLSTFYPPWRVDHDEVEAAEVQGQKLEVEIPDVHI